MSEVGERRPHLVIVQAPESVVYGSKGFPQSKKLLARDRQTHGSRLLAQLQAVGATSADQAAAQRALGLIHGQGIQIQFVGEPSIPLKLDSLELRSKGIELLSVVESEERMVATVFVPDGQLHVFLSKVQEYLERDTKSNKPSNQALVDPISEVKQSTLRALWTDESRPFPEGAEAVWWEVWLRKGGDTNYRDFLSRNAEALGLRVGDQVIDFLERQVILVWGAPERLAASLHLLVGIAELRAARDTAAMYSSMSVVDQVDWIQDAQKRMAQPPPDAAAVCVLDTGLNAANPLLGSLTRAAVIQAVNPAWGTDDHHGHGTTMAGMAAYGDLTDIMQSNSDFVARCRIESCKILPPEGGTDPQLYGAITRAAVSLAEIADPQSKRVIQTAVTVDGTTTGKPSSWSAEIDAIASGAEDGTRRMFVLSVGNVAWATYCEYPDEAHASTCEDPSQSWNALAVGGYTEKVWLDPETWPDDQPIASAGGLCPESRTSLGWQAKWPVRPDIVMEAGNLNVNSKTKYASDSDDLGLLSTGRAYLEKPLVITRGTSAAGAQAAGLAAEVMSRYPDFWPETVRGLIVHSSEWTQAMLDGVASVSGKQRYRHLLRTCGWGVPNRNRVLHSAANSLTLVAQEVLRPYQKSTGAGVKFRDMHLHTLPWPVQTLRDLFDTEVALRVTLSYFIEPSPGERGYGGPFTYASHGLRFALQAEDETETDFRNRVNVAARDEEDDGIYGGDSVGWLIGPHNRNKGSLHSDSWRGSASALASRRHLSVYPVAGWWRSRPHLKRVESKARYALIVSIVTPEIGVDLYAQIQQRLAVPVAISVAIG